LFSSFLFRQFKFMYTISYLTHGFTMDVRISKMTV
jgi:hypothetical protein